MNITFSVENQIITRTDNNVIVSGSKNFLRAVFTLSPAWRPDHTITPIFRVGDKSYYPEMKNGHFLDENNSCIVPHEVLSSAGVFFVSVFDETDNVRITANESPVRVVQSGYADAEPSLIPSPTVYDEILRSYGDLRRKVDEMQIADGLQLDGDTLHLTVNGVPIGTTAQLPPPVTVDTELSEESENPVQNKAVAAEMRKLDEEMLDAFSQSAEMMKELIDNTPTGLIAENETLHMVAGDKTIGSGIPFTPIPTTITLENNTIQLMAGQTKIGGGVQLRKTPTLLDTFTVAEGEEPVLFFEKKLTGQNWRHVWINGEIYSSDTAASQTFHLRTGAGTEIFRQAFKYWDRGKAYVSAEMRRMPNGRIVGEIALSLHQYTNELGVYGKSVGRFNAEYINGVHISLDNQTQMFAAGTQIEVWGME